MTEQAAVYRTRIVELRLPWPDRRLSPNQRGAWQAKLPPKQEAKLDAYQVGKSWLGWKPIGNEKLELRLMFFPPDLRRRDIDNLHASLKAALDGISMGLGINDWQFRRTVLEWGAVDKPGYILVEIVPFVERGEMPY